MMRFYGIFKDVEIVPQVEEQFKMVTNKVFMIPWGHIKLLIDKCHDDIQKFGFYIDRIIENNWSRAVLLNFIDTDLFERQGQAITNFKYTSTEPIGISEYELNALLPKTFEGTLPTIEELEQGLSKDM